ncbi:hypothetical protein HK102_003346, partial [Quaeritorhiza haematococci]
MAPAATKDLGFFAPAINDPELDEAPMDVDSTPHQQQQPQQPQHPSYSAPLPASQAKSFAFKAPPQTQRAPPAAPKRRPPPGDIFTPTLVEIESDGITKLAEENWGGLTRLSKREEGEGKEGKEGKFDEKVVERIWNEELVRSGFSLRKVMLLEFSQYLEKYLWPNFNPETSTVKHVLSIVVMVNEKFHERVSGVWDTFTSTDPEKFTAFFHKVLELLVDPIIPNTTNTNGDSTGSELTLQVRRFLLIFLIHCFQSLENPVVRSQCMKLVNVSVWHCLVDDSKREQELTSNPQLVRMWLALEKKFKSADKETKQKLVFQRTFLSRLLKSFIRVLNSIPKEGPPPAHSVSYCERFVEFLIDLEAQLPTRRFFNSLLHDHLIVPLCLSSDLYARGSLYRHQNREISLMVPADWGSRGSESGALFVQLVDQLKFYSKFEINDGTGAALTDADMTRLHYRAIQDLQKIAFTRFKDVLEDFALANTASVETGEALREAFGSLPDEELRRLCGIVHVRMKKVEIEGDDEEEGSKEKMDVDGEGDVYYSREFLVQLLVSKYEKRVSQAELINSLPLYPDEDFLFDETLVPATQFFPNTHCLAIPKLNLQFLTVHDYLLRNFTLFRLESTYEIRQDVEDVVKRLAPRFDPDSGITRFSGWARMGCLLEKFEIVDVGAPRLGDTKPSYVKADVTFNLSKFTESIRREWDSLRPHDILFLLAIQSEPELPGWQQHQQQQQQQNQQQSSGAMFRRQFGLRYVRGCEICDLIGEDGKPVEEFAWTTGAAGALAASSGSTQEKGSKGKGSFNKNNHRRTFRVLLDTNQYYTDMSRISTSKMPDIYDTSSLSTTSITASGPPHPCFNVIMRRKPQENNFKAVLETIRDLIKQSELVVPPWLHDIFLGYGDPGKAEFRRMPGGMVVRTLDFRDTFLDWRHLAGSFPGMKCRAIGALSSSSNEDESKDPISPPYVITFPTSMFESLAPKSDTTATAGKRGKTKKSKAAAPDASSTTRGGSVSAGVKRKLNGDVVESGKEKGGDGKDEKHVEQDEKTLLVRTYKMPNMGPYPENVPKQNAVRFTPTQVEAIHAGTSPGLTMIVGPPGTGKTDVAVQIIANLYHNYPDQHTLLITHSNQALNQLFEKIVALDIDPRHLLRLGHGEEELEITGPSGEHSWGKAGRVNSFLERRLELLSEVDRLAQTVGVPGAHGYTCETAGYFYVYHVLSRWEPYYHRIQAKMGKVVGKDNKMGGETAQQETKRTRTRTLMRADVVSDFPFTSFFDNAPQPLFPPEASFEECLDIAEGCYRHIKNMFDQLEEIRAFEILRSNRDRSNYLLVKEARIVALTCTHAALKRRELVKLGFRYDNVIMEEAAQILEVETFIPLLLQSPDVDHQRCVGGQHQQQQQQGGIVGASSRLQRVVMIGDHNQLPPVVKNMAFQRYGNMEQSLFTRFVRLGVPTVTLDAQGRCRPSIAELFRWQYPKLGDLPYVVEGGRGGEYKMANPGFAYDYQVVDVPDYMGKGETEPLPHFVQNLGEAEYVVATFMYMRLLGYPAEKITILTTYNGQKELIKDVLNQRCSWNPLFGTPHRVATVDKYQGQQNDYILLSLVRTKTVGHLRDVRRLVVAMSRARLG